MVKIHTLDVSSRVTAPHSLLLTFVTGEEFWGNFRNIFYATNSISLWLRCKAGDSSHTHATTYSSISRLFITYPNVCLFINHPIHLSSLLHPSICHSSIHLFYHPSVHSSIHLSVIHPSICSIILLFIHPSICQSSIHPSVHSSIHLSFIHPSICSFIHPSVFPFIHPSINLPFIMSIQTSSMNLALTYFQFHSCYRFFPLCISHPPPLILSLIHPSTHSSIHSFIHPLIHSFINSIIYSSIHSFIHSLIHPSTHSFIHPFFNLSRFTSLFHNAFIQSL